MCPRRRGRDLGLGRAVENVVKETVEDLVEKRELEKKLLEESGEGGSQEEAQEGAQDRDGILQKIISSFPSSKGYYGKLYKLLSSGNLEMKYYFAALEDLQDPEAEVANLAKERRWGSGTYKLRVFKHGETGVKRGLTFNIDAEVQGDPSGASSLREPEKIGDKIREVVEIVHSAKELVPKGEPAPSIDPGKLGQVLSDTFKSGVEIAKMSIPEKKKGDGEDDTGIFKLIDKLQQIGVIPTTPKEAPPRDTRKELIEVLSLLKELGIVNPPKKDDFFEQLAKFQSIGLVKKMGEDETFSSVEKLKSLIELVTPLINPTGEKATFGIEAVRVIGPHVPRIIGDITSAVKEVTDVAKMKLESSMGIAPTRKAPAEIPAPAIMEGTVPPPYRRPIPLEGASPSESQIETERPRSPNPIVDEILEAVYKKDLSYFPKLQEMLVMFVGPHTIEALVTEQVSQGTFMSMVASYGQGVFNTKEAKEYLGMFVDYLKSKHSSQEPPVSGGGIVGKCNTCGAEFEFDSEEAFADPSNQVCDCGGAVERVSPLS